MQTGDSEFTNISCENMRAFNTQCMGASNQCFSQRENPMQSLQRPLFPVFQVFTNFGKR